MTAKQQMSKASFKEFLELLWINLRVQGQAFIEFLRVVFYYYTNLSFLKIDLSLLLTYLFNSPFLISKKFLINRGQTDVYAYGETPLTTFDYILTQCQVESTDALFELGCGRGRTCFWAALFKKCKVVGIEHIPEFISKANDIKKKFNLDTVEFRKQDLLLADFSNATVLYLYGTSLEDEYIKKLLVKFQKLPPGTKIITISYSLNEYTTMDNYEVMKRFLAHFPWGNADVYLQIKK